MRDAQPYGMAQRDPATLRPLQGVVLHELIGPSVLPFVGAKT